MTVTRHKLPPLSSQWKHRILRTLPLAHPFPQIKRLSKNIEALASEMQSRYDKIHEKDWLRTTITNRSTQRQNRE